MKTKTLLVFVVALILGQTASAAEEMVNLGPYQVSFSLAPSANCSIEVGVPAYSRTPSGTDYAERSIHLDCDEGRALIKVTNYHSPVPAGDRETRALSRKAPWTIGYVGIETRERLVDRHAGFLTTFEEVSGRELHQVAYWLDRYLAPDDYLGETSCVVSSSLPWTATEELIDSVHVEKEGVAQKPSTNETVTVGPYQVSFDLGGKNYTIIQEGPLLGEGEEDIGLERHRIILDGVNRAASIVITSYDNLSIVNLETERLLAEAALQGGGYTKNNASEWTVGGEPGVLGIGEDEDHQILYVAIFWPDHVQTKEGAVLGMTRCEIDSSYWWDTTERLLETIRVERIEEA
ncbi:MAG TPA: hypothetical protein PLM24_02845 [Methanothrix sp.]|nr:hypothetical protein [Methanothrix sp.]HPJ84037.1 hypothetical protein [Methanothrix sp.]HPR66054.1 hypothetical protein [Methanothrix sp.]